MKPIQEDKENRTGSNKSRPRKPLDPWEDAVNKQVRAYDERHKKVY